MVVSCWLDSAYPLGAGVLEPCGTGLADAGPLPSCSSLGVM
jgi:hypothetical protein